ncbi:cbb3-type cytochrome-c oxidase subunit FixQ 1 (plasmid) [Rhizobium gallicum]|uniref:Cbb3-type cytochrome-c oxidase subunit FixQ 1 n=2 Tax=Rhizobium TaxID=379 RepID=A0A1L5NQM8_9HYPH|nr:MULTISPECIES: CcoQ/FixQ family Cbb3-type cytochrome c oxidase assembly chaperone [Rhizobium]APO70215.1 cbb3-type cytochrome-c oxidase subunit FixQ 1 [Rhizobium gallicum]TCU32906.1 cytochrome c oxidase cbb3-type subunit 4 [Rhizobium azibense]
METYNAMRHFADSWGLLAMAVFFVGALSFILRPGSKQIADDAAIIPLKDE